MGILTLQNLKSVKHKSCDEVRYHRRPKTARPVEPTEDDPGDSIEEKDSANKDLDWSKRSVLF